VKKVKFVYANYEEYSQNKYIANGLDLRITSFPVFMQWFRRADPSLLKHNGTIYHNYNLRYLIGLRMHS